MSRPLAPHTEATPEFEDNRLGPAARHAALPSQPVSLHTRPLHERERSISSRYPPLAQASNAPMAPHSPAMALNEEPPQGIHAQPGLPPRMSGPRLGYFHDDRRDTVLSHATPRAHDHALSSRQVNASAPEIARMEPLPSQGFRGVEMHGSPLMSGQSATGTSHQAYLQSLAQSHAQPPPLLSHSSHSRQPSLTKPPGSPLQALGRPDPEMSHIRRDSMGQRSFYPLSAPHVGVSQAAPVLSPSRELPRAALTPVEPEPPRQVPAKRSNIMSILNDEPEEPQPRKRFASDQSSTMAAGPSSSPSRPVYTGGSSLPQPPSRQEESILSASQPRGSAYPQQNPYQPPSRPYSEYSSYSSVPGTSGPAGNNDWLGRFDPRNQQSQQPSSAPPPPSSRPSTTLAPQPPYSPFASSQTPSAQMLSNLNAPSPAPTPPPVPVSQRPSYPPSVYAPSPAPQSQGTGGARDIPSQGSIYRSAISSPTPRNSHIAYSSRPGLSSIPSYGSSAQTVPVTSHMPGTPQQHPSGPSGYSQMQPLVAHQPQPHRPHLGLGGTPYGRNTPPPQPSASRMAPLSSAASQQIGRSYTPPTVLQPTPTGGMAYAPNGPGNPHPLQARAVGPGSLHEPVPVVPGPGPHGGSAHHSRVYSQGSNPYPGPLPSQHPSR
ncbi:MYB DNA-binding domain protein [Aspergillus undulatus]|uniref:MYB DNA-binding domain protein n=1 Tax=Aspergillus undulatus TaxID=1810928 RepID=UPI003CCE405F